MENQENPRRFGGDGRTFVIALLTAIIVVALYHFGSGLWRVCFTEIEFQDSRPNCVPAPAQPQVPGCWYVMVPVMPQPCRMAPAPAPDSAPAPAPNAGRGEGTWEDLLGF